MSGPPAGRQLFTTVGETDMGLLFPLKLANQVAFFTTDMPGLTCRAHELRDFFHILKVDDWRIITGREPAEWKEGIQKLAGAAEEIVLSGLRRGLFEPNSVVSIHDVFVRRDRAILDDLKKHFDSFELYALGVASLAEAGLVNRRLFEAAPAERYRNVLFLILDNLVTASLDFFDPFPGASDICRYPERWPGVLLWDAHANSLFLPLDAAMAVLETWAARAVPKDLGAAKNHIREPPTSAVRLLHLSDFHCGRQQTAKNQVHLLSSIADEFKEKYDKIIISGDLFDSPWIWKWREFDNFRQMIRITTKHKPLVIPGNHDLRIRGNMLWKIGAWFRPAAELEWSMLEADEKLKCLFFSFNSAKKGNFARGEVLPEDLVDAGAEYQILAHENPDIRNWLRVAIVHHHPFSFDAAAEGWTANMIKRVGLKEGDLVDMDHSQRFVNWCADRGVQLILFGHRHVPRKITQLVAVGDEDQRTNVTITAIGCGTSLGAEGAPLSFNIVSWDPDARRWGAVFYMDEHGGGFKKVRGVSLEIDPVSRHLPAA
jgi:predicted MPP superfamily phosphohydrolase